MATIKAFIRTSTKITEANIRIRLSDGRGFTRYYTTDIVVPSDCWDNKKEEVKARVILPDKYDKGKIHESIRDIKNKIEIAFAKVDNKEFLPTDWIDIIISGRILNGKESSKIYDLPELFDLYYDSLKTSEGRKKQVRGTRTIFNRFLLFYNLRQFKESSINRLEDFILNEHKYQYLKPDLYKGGRKVAERGGNSVHERMKVVIAFFRWLAENEYIDRSPFLKYTLKPPVYGDPIPLLPEEVDALLAMDLKGSNALIRDMFCLQCFIGCRIGDYIKLRKENVDGDILIYVAQKTKHSKPRTVYVPLINKALDIINKYDCPDGRLLPFINVNGQAGYNKKIKVIAELAGLNRNVVVMNTLTQQPEVKKLHDVITTHTARRTFINSNYQETQDPALISKMTGHSEYSKSFARYRKIDMDILKKQMERAFNK